MATVKFSGNKGEWSEPYVVLRLAADGLLRQAEENMQPSDDKFARIVKIVREDLCVELEEDGAATFHFTDDAGMTHHYFVPSGGSEERAQKLLRSLLAIKKAEGSFELPDIDNELQYLGFRQLKNPVPKGQRFVKRDLSLMIQDPNTGIAPTLGFSVKSELGSAPTLLNASKQTNIIYRVYGINDRHMESFNSIFTRTKIQDRCAYLTSVASEIKFCNYQSDTFMRNLQIVDGDLPQMIADATLVHYTKNIGHLCDVVELLNKTPRYADCDPVFCAVKVKRFLRACALGMVPSEPWKDYDDASGGYVIVLPNGELIAFYIYNRALFDKYLFDSTKFERGDMGRHDYMSIYKEGDKYYLKLNLQIRFTR